MVISKRLSSALVVASLAVATTAHADPPAPAPAAAPAIETPSLHHAPQVTARISEDITIGAVVDRPDRVKRALLVFHGGGARGEVEFERSSEGPLGYVAVIPATAVRPDLAYSIEIETTTGEQVPVFATRAAPHHVTVLDSPADRREADLLTRLKGRRSVVQSSGEYASFGSTTGSVAAVTPPGGVPVPATTRKVPDMFYRIEGSYTYRLLGTVSEFGLRAGIVRGQSLVRGETDPSKYEVGLNYGAPRIRLRAEDWLHVEGELLTSVTEVGFAVGGGGAVLLGDAYGSKLVLGMEGIQVFGVRGFTRLDLVANSRLMLAPMIEVTTMPHADVAGVRLLGEAGIDLGGGIRADVRAGYQARRFDQGGPTLGGGLAYAF
ncbi:MAG: hypothetical protein JWP87_3945 [Labilithrix sp.]|nr:hypothetical protein [Labilithrix sp.]